MNKKDAELMARGLSIENPDVCYLTAQKPMRLFIDRNEESISVTAGTVLHMEEIIWDDRLFVRVSVAKETITLPDNLCESLFGEYYKLMKKSLLRLGQDKELAQSRHREKWNRQHQPEYGKWG